MIKEDFLTREEMNILAELKNELEKLLGDQLKKLVLYGSKARGDYDADSDIDIAIVVDGLKRKSRNQILDMVAHLEMKYLIPLSTLILSNDNFEKLKKRERRLASDIEKEGISL